MSEEVKTLVKTVKQQQEHILSLINDIMAMPRISRPVAVIKPVTRDSKVGRERAPSLRRQMFTQRIQQQLQCTNNTLY